MRQVETMDETNRHWIEYRGDPRSWMNQFMHPPQNVVQCTQGNLRGCAPIMPGRRTLG
jgi:hypothetical protein